jgi:SAM-dependent methyltransferase
MNRDSGTGRLADIREAIEEVRQDRVLRRPPGPRVTPAMRQGDSGLKGRVGRLPGIGHLLRWSYGLMKAPTRIKDLLTLIRLAEMETSRARGEARARDGELEDALADLRAAQVVAADLAADGLDRTSNLELRVKAAEAGQTTAEALLSDLRDQVGRLEEGAASAEAVSENLSARLAGAESAVARSVERMDRVADALADMARKHEAASEQALVAARRQSHVAALYESLEERFRGPRALILERQSIYLPSMQELEVIEKGLPVLDLGCGRGEWLEALEVAGIPGLGVESNPALVASCRTAGLQVEQTDVESFLSARADSSARAVTCFHLLEHMPFPDWLHLVGEIWRVLAPGGVAIFETPNPDNLLIAAGDFYLDPTHVRPIPSQLLLFVAESAGFERCRVMELHPRDTGATTQGEPGDALLRRHLQGPQDYSVLGWKPGVDSP